jgi:hypothetical protein
MFPRSAGAAAYATSLAADLGSELLYLHALQNGSRSAEEEREIRERIGAGQALTGFSSRGLARLDHNQYGPSRASGSHRDADQTHKSVDTGFHRIDP